MWKKAKRAVDNATAAAIAAVARDGGAAPVGVFVDEGYEEIVERCGLAGISTAQLHGDGARATLHLIPPSLQVGRSTHIMRSLWRALCLVIVAAAVGEALLCCSSRSYM